jgi:lysophospholipase L1-like esterase
VNHRRFIATTGIIVAALAVGGPAAAGQGMAATAATASRSAADMTAKTPSTPDLGGDRDRHLEKFDYYLALGDSLAVGVQPNAAGLSLPTSQGYADDLAAQLRERNRHLTFVDLGCPGETTTTMLAGGCPFPHSYTNQVSAAVAFLTAHPHARILVTLDIGANNVDGCATASGINVACVGAGLATAAGDLPKILGALTTAAGKRVEFAAMNYYNPFLALWLTGPAGQQQAIASVQLQAQLNGILQQAYSAFGIPVADVSAAFDSTDFTPLVQLTPTLQVPLNVARVCQWTWMCAPAPVGPNIHANKDGYVQIKDAFEAILDAR